MTDALATKAIAETMIVNDPLALAGGPVSPSLANGYHNADLIIAALEAAGFVIASKGDAGNEAVERAFNLVSDHAAEHEKHGNHDKGSVLRFAAALVLQCHTHPNAAAARRALRQPQPER